MDCPFCNVEVEKIALGNRSSIVIKDMYPVSLGHSLILPTRHVTKFEDLSHDEILGIMINVKSTMLLLQLLHKPDGFNVGFNLGEAAGQTIEHLHMHVIPRYEDDVPEARGGIRGVIPDRRDYL
jgi:diadenosine tetraphosphate (Ap4A) HIT family hydrolase